MCIYTMMEEQMKYKNINKSKCHCITLRRATSAITDYYDKALLKTGISTSQFSLLINLSRLGEASTSELAEYVNLERSTLVRNLKPLTEKGFIADLARKGARNHKYTLSDEGQRIVQKCLPIWEQAQKDIEAYLGEENVDFFMKLLYRLQELNAE